MIPTVTDYLFVLNRDKREMQDKLDKRKAFILTLLLFTVVAIGVMAWILQ